MQPAALSIHPQFPRASKYNPDWVLASSSGAANALWITEWLMEVLDLKPGMRVLDLGCGRAMSSIFLHRELGVQVWATDLWFSASQNLQRIQDAGAGDAVFPLNADAKSLPFARDFFDAIVCIDSFCYFGTDEMYLPYLARLVKPGGIIAIAGASVVQECDGPVPEHLRPWWAPEMNSLHSAAWWKRHWEKTGIVDIEHADTMPNGCALWLDWMRTIAPDNAIEIAALESDNGRYLGYTRIVSRRKPGMDLPDPITTIPGEYVRLPMLRE